MAGTNKFSHGDDEVYEAVDARILSGSLVVPSTTPATNPGLQGVKTADDGDIDVIGVASHQALPVDDQQNTGTDADGYPFVNATGVPEETLTVYSHGVFAVRYVAAAVPYGAPLAAAAAGAVRALTDTDDPRALIGFCRVVGGMSAAGGLGHAKIVR